MLKNNLMPKVLFLYNPSSGKGLIEKNLAFIKEQIIAKFGSVDVYRSESPEDFCNQIKAGCESYDYILFSGGDGTFNMAVNSIPLEKGNLPIFGYIPGGSTCDMSYNLNISKNPRKGVLDCVNSKPKKYNVGIIGSHKFIYVADCGSISKISHITTQQAKRKMGTSAYIGVTLKTLFHVKPFEITVDGVKYVTSFVCVSNSKEIASFRITPDKKQDDQNYFLAICKNGFARGFFNLAYVALFGLEKAIKKKKVISYSAKTFMINTKEKEWDVDGELATIEFPSVCGYSGHDIEILTNRE